MIAFIPARSGSKRVPDKNIRELDGHPLLAYTIRSAIDSGVFEKVICITDSEKYAEVARKYGAEVPAIRPNEISGDKSPDIQWVKWIFSILKTNGIEFNSFSILRPTSPFRQPETIRRAYAQFINSDGIDSLRAVEKCEQHPGKMWIIRGDMMYPLIPFTPEEQPWHSSQYASLPEIYVQNASLEMAWSKVVEQTNSIAGNKIIPFITYGNEGVDVNTEFDWWKAERLIQVENAKLYI
ncbi:MAG: acylneuraminate cytidylyltransferase family protein [Cyclobacteriaceae bacterium]|nr:acylneuraminate cytidylyltransferase family protein [Cyclobacteriaceae bacterium]